MFERIVLAVDSSDQAKRAASAAVDLARKSQGEILVVHVHDLGLTSRETVDLETQDEARLLTMAYLDVVARQGVSVRSELRAAKTADIAKEILAAAKAFEADAIVLGSRGLGEFAGLLLGSVAHRVIQLADCPVVVVRAATSAAERGREKREKAVA